MEEINKQVEKAYGELIGWKDEYNIDQKNRCQRINEAPCSVCRKKEFIVLYRDVNGKIEGRISGYFSLFGGSINGYIDGETHTDPVLSCRNCHNERKIVLPDTKNIEDFWNMQIPYISTYEKLKPYQSKVSPWLQGYGIEVACELCRKIYPKDYQSFYRYNIDKYPRLTETEFNYLGLKIKYNIEGYIKPKTYWVVEYKEIIIGVSIALAFIVGFFYLLISLS